MESEAMTPTPESLTEAVRLLNEGGEWSAS